MADCDITCHNRYHFCFIRQNRSAVHKRDHDGLWNLLQYYVCFHAAILQACSAFPWFCQSVFFSDLLVTHHLYSGNKNHTAPIEYNPVVDSCSFGNGLRIGIFSIRGCDCEKSEVFKLLLLSCKSLYAEERKIKKATRLGGFFIASLFYIRWGSRLCTP